MNDIMFFKGNHMPHISINWIPIENDEIADPTYLLIVRKPVHYTPPNDPTDDPITVEFRKSHKAPLLSVVSYTSTFALPTEKLNKLKPGIYPLLISVNYTRYDRVNTFAQQGSLEVVDKFKLVPWDPNSEPDSYGPH